ncbi:FAD-binding oxidoreductase [Shinella curvata]|uniref:FAD-binding oxidoreductase n=2 Tax=Shinella curvata TaxID=1817964 RepID=A0ABT8XC12_9HYPH|nr:FAD-binding oxidoreductase [Shinella curvata]MCJ8054641.1 FAD-binding oxidoreductase [Shinella curvata]MDO6120964.1 FAD-binding oxidoreductase [Shinella curvata]
MGVTSQAVLPASLWAATAAKAPTYAPSGSVSRADVAVVGAGYTGLSTALHLAKRGLNVLVIEASEPGWGASGRNGGQIISGLKFEPDELEREFGDRLGPVMVSEMGSSGSLVRSLIEQYQIDCHARFDGWIHAAHGDKPMREIVGPRASQWKSRGVSTRVLDSAEVARMVGTPAGLYAGGWLDPRGGVLQPLSYARGLARAAIEEGATIYAYTPVRSISRSAGKWRLNLGSSEVIADRVVLATNAYTDDLWPGLKQTVVPVTSFQVATYPLPEDVRNSVIPGGQGVTDTRRLLHYFRLDHEGRLVMGGRSPVDDNPTMDDAAALTTTIARTFPQAASAPIQFLWSGKVALTKDSLPHIHVLDDGLFAALGCNGRGVANCTMIGKVMSEFVAGARADDLPLPVTAPDPFKMHAFRKIGVIVASQYYRLLDKLESK